MSSNEQHENQGGSPGGWEPIPQSEGYDGDATAFVQLPPDFMLDGVPLEAPGHGYVPPMITPLQPLTPTAATDPAATGTWSVHVPAQAERTQYFDGNEYAEQDPARHFPQQGAEYGEQPEHFGQGGHFGQGEQAGQAEHFGRADQAEYFGQDPQAGPGAHVEYGEQDPHATAEWRFAEAPPVGPGPGGTGQWEIPLEPLAPDTAGPGEPGDGGDFAATAVRPYAEAPATLPGGAPAPWALPEEPVAEPAAEGVSPEPVADAPEEPVADVAAEPADDEPGTPDTETAAPASDPARMSEADPATDAATGPAPAADASDAAPAPGSVHASTDSDEHPHTSYTLRVNGADRPVTDSWIGESLLYVLRERLGLAGAKDGCSQGECGACNVQVDGRLVASCLVPAATAAGSEVRTVEGLAVDGEPSDVQRAMARCGTVQCGFCIPGMCMTVHDLLEGNHAPTELETRQALAGNLCRCSGYRGVLEAVRDVVAEREASAAATAADGADEPRVPHQIPHPHDGGMA
ncbi:2Fe-2S iron-sulfur cluster-binding protein [Streptomyces sp. NPDC012693]|jgi:aerobic-type carbon monoxide dehydrogenase small subunit (CoxS/CutS family)|uniref:2Fe-2S iron-sulfur cluster-binding protein n=1 Tax=Streptomyces sp. NPDC012693 TaxID=3364844 RepID=UPI0036AD365F